MLSGLWHGAAWTFVAWGIFHACCFIPHVLRRPVRPAPPAGAVQRSRSAAVIAQLARTVLTFVLVCIGWVFFRSESIVSAFRHLRSMVSDVHFHTPYGGFSTLYPVVFVVAVEWLTRHRAHALDHPPIGLLRYRAVRWALYYALLFAVAYWGGAQSAFIYFQF